MYIKAVERQLKNGVAIDFKVNESYRNEEGKPRNRTLRTWTANLVYDLNSARRKEEFLERVQEDMEDSNFKLSEQKKIITLLRKAMREFL